MAQNVVRYSPDEFSLHAATTKVYVCITLSGLSSNGKSLMADVTFLNSFSITPNYRQRGQIISVIWKAPTHPWVKVNTDGSLLGGHASCGGIFRDHKGSFLSCFASNLGQLSFLEAEIHGFLLAMEYAAQHQWSRLWIESDSTSAVSAFKNPSVIPFGLRNRWHNCTHGGFQVIASHIFCEGNGCANKLANHGPSVLKVVWWDTLPIFVREDFFRDKFGTPNFPYP